MRIRGRFFFPICKEFERIGIFAPATKKEIRHLDSCRDFYPGFFMPKIKKYFADIKNIYIFAVLKRCGDFRRTLKTKKMERVEKIKRFMLMTQMWGYFRHAKPSPEQVIEMNNAIKDDVNFDTLAEAYNRLFIDENWVQINRENDLEEYNKLMSMTEEEFAEEYFAVEGYYYE